MNARDNTLPLRNLIAQHLDRVEDATANQIARAVGLKDYPSRVIAELNAMRADALIECEQRGKTKELSYWLSVPAAQILNAAQPEPAIAPPPSPADLPEGVRPGTRGAQIWDALRPGRALTVREIASALKCSTGSLDPTISALYKAGTIGRTKNADRVFCYHRPHDDDQHEPQPAEGNITGSNGLGSPSSPEAVAVQPQPAAEALASHRTPEHDSVAADVTDDDAIPEPDLVLLAAANRRLIEQSDALSREIEEAAEKLAPFVESDIDTTDMELPELASAVARRLGDLEHELDMLKAEAFKLQQQIDGAQDIKDVAAGYLVKAPKRRPRVITNPASARAAALAAAKSTGRADVMALVPVGRAVRGAEWREA